MATQWIPSLGWVWSAPGSHLEADRLARQSVKCVHQGCSPRVDRIVGARSLGVAPLEEREQDIVAVIGLGPADLCLRLWAQRQQCCLPEGQNVQVVSVPSFFECPAEQAFPLPEVRGIFGPRWPTTSAAIIESIGRTRGTSAQLLIRCRICQRRATR
jgi:hypothetical protein